jgi:hypothetical protein
VPLVTLSGDRMDIKFSYETYQDVRDNLFKYAVVPLNIVGATIVLFVFPPAWRVALKGILDTLIQEPWKTVVDGAGVIAAFTILAFLLIEVFKVHDRLYDKYIIRWRAKYDADTIIPRLVRKLGARLPDRFFEEASRNLKQFMERLYYWFVTDHEPKISKNLLVRFYERVTIYWLTQVNEILLLFLASAIAIGRALGPSTVEYRTTLLTVLLLTVGAFALNRLWVRNSREGVQEATFAEIDAITADHFSDLEDRVQQLCKAYSIPFARG